MSRRLAIGDLLNPEPTAPASRDAAPLLRALGAPVSCATLPVTSTVYEAMHDAVHKKDSRTLSTLSAHSLASKPPSSSRHGVYLNAKTTLSTLFVYDDVDAYVEFPESGIKNPVGYLMRIDPKNFQNPMRDFVYSQGDPSGQTVAGKVEECILLVDPATRQPVPCAEKHYTC